MSATPPGTARPGFAAFYREHYLPDHRHPVNVGLHVAGTVAGLVFVPVALASSLPWLAVLFPAVHALPGLLGHRLFERNLAIGDLRVLRTDFSPLWFIAANHVLTFGLLRAGAKRLGRRA